MTQMHQRRDWQQRWRSLAKALLPSVLESFDRSDPNGGPMRFFFEVLPEFQSALQSNDEPRLVAALEFARWSLAQPEKELWNAAGVAFWELLFDDWKQSARVAAWIPPDVICLVDGLWRFRLGEKRAAETQALLKNIEPKKFDGLRHPTQLDASYLP
ncbi:MAG: hypothetical protein ABL957_16310 [Parvularculaceae bacterium]